jgi:hypothetical protein
VNGLQGTFTIDVYPVVSLNAGTYTGYANRNAAFANANDGDTIIIYNNQTISSNTNPEGMTITLQGYSSARKITLTTVGPMFDLSDSGTTLVLGENITLDGEGAANGNSLVKVGNNAVLVMEDGSTITGNKKNLGGGGGGVYVCGGTFTMSGGTISGNESSTGGGGVSVYGGSFTMSGGTMSGGTISGNSASGNGGGGGVRVQNGTFIMSGGTISGNNASSESIGNGKGGGVYVASNGKFTYNTGTITGNTATDYGNAVYKYSVSTIDGTVTVESGGPDTPYDTFPPGT